METTAHCDMLGRTGPSMMLHATPYAAPATARTRETPSAPEHDTRTPSRPALPPPTIHTWAKVLLERAQKRQARASTRRIRSSISVTASRNRSRVAIGPKATPTAQRYRKSKAFLSRLAPEVSAWRREQACGAGTIDAIPERRVRRYGIGHGGGDGHRPVQCGQAVLAIVVAAVGRHQVQDAASAYHPVKTDGKLNTRPARNV
eukprot:scaffold1280_cov379-Prasinococcus_capsulatus_cf.AAC.20